MLLAGDEASLYLQASLMRVWALVGQTPVVRVATNRDNTHFYGALNLLTGQETVMRSAVMTGEVSVLFLQQILSAYPDAPILLSLGMSCCCGIERRGIKGRRCGHSLPRIRD